MAIEEWPSIPETILGFTLSDRSSAAETNIVTGNRRSKSA